MNKNILKALCGIVLIVLAAMMASCTDAKKEVAKFVVDFATKVSKNQKDSLKEIYPETNLFDSLALTIVTDSIIVKETGKENEFVVSLGNGADITVVKEGEGMKVTSSHGLLAFDKETMDFAKNTGLWKPSIDDVMLAQRMSESDALRQWLIQNNVKNIARNVKVVGDAKALESHDGENTIDIYGVLGYTVQNNTNMKIDGSDYKVYFSGTNRGFDYRESESGKDIAPHSTVVYKRVYSFYDIPGSAYVNFSLPQEELFKKYYEFTGKEYEEYLSQKTK